MTAIVEFLKTIPLAAWTAFIAFFGVWLTNWNNRKSIKIQLEHAEKLQRHRLAKERLEELYSQVCKWETEIMFSNMQISRVMDGQMEMAQYKEAMLGVDDLSDFNRIAMIAGIYGHSFQSTFDELLGARNDLSSVISLWLHSYAQSAPNQTWAKQFVAKQPRLVKAIEDFKKDIVRAAKEI